MDEWTNALTGVGAAIDAGSQAENGICALFVIAAKIIKNISKLLLIGDNIKFQEELNINKAIDRIIKESPIRLVSAVINLAALDLLFW